MGMNKKLKTKVMMTQKETVNQTMGENDWNSRIVNCLETLRNDNGEEQSEQILLHEVPSEYEALIIGGLEELAKTESNNAYWPHFIGRYYLKLSRYDEAVTWFEEAFKRNSHATELAYLAYACHRARRWTSVTYSAYFHALSRWLRSTGTTEVDNIKKNCREEVNFFPTFLCILKIILIFAATICD